MCNVKKQLAFYATFAMLASCLAGCTQLNTVAALRSLGIGKHKYIEATPQNPAVEILALWQPAEGAGPNGLPTRGLAGQIMFFTRGHETPVKVNGETRIYLFDDVGTEQAQSKPIHQFKFASDVWNMQLQDSLLGPSYQVFVPYVRRDPHRVNCTLSVKFTSANAPTIYSKMVTVTLPGPPRPEPEKVDNAEAKSEAVRTAADQHMRNEFSKYMNKRNPAAISDDDANTTTVAQPFDLKQLDTKSSSMSHIREMMETAAAEDAKARKSNDGRVQQAQQQLSHLLLQQSATDNTQAVGADASKVDAAPRFRLNSTEGNSAATLFEGSDEHPLAEKNDEFGAMEFPPAAKPRSGKPHLLEDDSEPEFAPARAEFAELPAENITNGSVHPLDSFDQPESTDTPRVRPVDDSDPWQSN
jgi:hypothetical protein